MTVNHVMIAIIAAVSENNVIGKDSKLPWRLPADMKYFKTMTRGNVVVMGRKTFQSLGKPLPDRVNIVITRQKSFKEQGVLTASSLQQALNTARQFEGKDIFIIGGGEIYRQSLDICDRIYLTRIHEHFNGDAFFPELPMNKWKMVSKAEHPPDEKNPHPYSFIIYDRIS